MSCSPCELGLLLVEALELQLRGLLALERRPGEILAAGGHRVARLTLELLDALLELGLLQLDALLARRDVGDPAAHLLEHLHLALVRVVERLARVFRLVEGLAGLRLEHQ